MVAIDYSTPAMVNANSATTVTTAAFTPPSGSLLVALVACTSGAVAAAGISDTSGISATSWTKLAAQTANGCDAEIWVKYLGSTPASNMTVTASFASGVNITLGVLVMTGAASTQTGATATSTSASGAPSASVTTTAAGSFPVAMIADATNQTAPANSGNAQTTVFNNFANRTFRTTDSGTHSAWAQQLPGAVTSSGQTVTIADTTPAGIAYSMVAVEIVPAAGSSINATDPPTGRTTITSPALTRNNTSVSLVATGATRTTGQLYPI